MAKPKVYLESSVISFYANRRSKDLVVAAYQEISADWWENELHKYQPYVSQFVVEEISRGDSRAAQNRMDAIKTFPSRINESLGVETPVICTPEELIENEGDNHEK